MAINFPDSPALNDYFESNGKAWIFNGTSWDIVQFPASLSIADASITGAKLAPGAASVNLGEITLGASTSGNYVSNVTASTGIAISHTAGEGSTATVSINATLDNLSDVTVPSPTNGEFLKWNGTAWVNASIPTINALDDIGNITAPSPSEGDFLKWNGTAWVNDPINLGTDTTGIYVADLTPGTGVTITNGSSESASPTISIGQSVATTASVTFAHVAADVTGNVTGNVTGSSGSTTGNSATATALQNARSISLTGDVSGSVSFNGTSDASISATIQPNSVALGTDTSGDYVSSLVAGTGVAITNNSGETATPTIAIGQAVGTSASVVFQQVETTGSLIIGQNLYVSGSIVTENQVSLEIDDPFIYLNTSASALGIDTGIVASYFDVSHKHAGYFRDASDGKFKFFDSYTPEPSSPINTSDASYSAAPVVAEYFESLISNGTAPLTVSSSTVVTNLNADKLDGQDGSYYATIDSPTFTGTVTLPNNTVALGTQTTGDYVSSLVAGTGVSLSNNSGESATPTIAIGQEVGTSSSVQFAAVTATLIGNASTVTNGVYTTSSVGTLSDVSFTTPTVNNQPFVWSTSLGKWTKGTSVVLSSGSASATHSQNSSVISSTGNTSTSNSTGITIQATGAQYIQLSNGATPTITASSTTGDDYTTVSSGGIEGVSGGGLNAFGLNGTSLVVGASIIQPNYTAPTSGQALVYNSTLLKWIPGSVSGGDPVFQSMMYR